VRAQSMEKHGAADEAARILCRKLYEFTDGWPMEWRRVDGGAAVYAALEHAVDHGWLMVDENSSICLTEAGRRLVRQTLS
jgi:hypothetical protein